MNQPEGAADRGEAPAIADALFVYFVVALAVSALLEPISAFFVNAGTEPLMAVLSQATATLLVLLYAAGWIVGGFRIPPGVGPRLAIGVGAMGLLLVSGAALAILIIGVWPWDLARRLASLEGAVVGASLILGALLPLVRVRRVEA